MCIARALSLSLSLSVYLSVYLLSLSLSNRFICCFVCCFIGDVYRRSPVCSFVDQDGAQKVVDEMSRLADKVGPWFAPAPVLVDTAKAGKKFYPKK